MISTVGCSGLLENLIEQAFAESVIPQKCEILLHRDGFVIYTERQKKHNFLE